MSATKLQTRTNRVLNTPDQLAALTKLAREIRSLHHNTESLVKSAREKAHEAIAEAMLCGKKLNDAKAIVKHGRFEQWFEANIKGYTLRTAQRYMRLAKSSHVTDLTNYTSLRQAYIDVGIINDSEQETNSTAFRFRADNGDWKNGNISDNPTDESENHKASGTNRASSPGRVVSQHTEKDAAAELIKRTRTLTVELASMLPKLDALPKNHHAEARRIIDTLAGKLLVFAKDGKGERK